MKVLVCGASGFVGSAICRCLAAAGHEVVRGVRRPQGATDVAIDYMRDTDAQAWLPRLQGIAAVVNAVGIIVEQGDVRFTAVHHLAPAALFSACAEAGVKRVVQISALGATHGDTPYFHSKLEADRHLQSLPLEWMILRPSLVYGEEGDASIMFRTLAAAPLAPAPRLNNALFAPVHVDDVAAAVAAALEPQCETRKEIDVVGVNVVSYEQMIACYARAMGMHPGVFITIPATVMRLVAAVAGQIPGSPLTPDNYRMLRMGSCAPPVDVTRLLGRSPLPMDKFIPPERADVLRRQARAKLAPPLLLGLAAAAVVAVGALYITASS